MQDFDEKCSKDFWTTTAIEMVVWPPYQVQAQHQQSLAPDRACMPAGCPQEVFSVVRQCLHKHQQLCWYSPQA